MAIKPLGSSGDRDDESGDSIVAEINITPLVDVFLVLLIIFMVTSSVMSQTGVDVDLPAASSEVAGTQPEGVIVTLLPAGEVRVNQTPVKPGDWGRFERLLGEALKDTKSALVVLEGDRKAFLGSAIELMDHARRAGARRFAIATTEK